jgi:anti-sigma factor RsiW
MSSSMCEHEIDVEDLAMGLLQGEEAENARRHLESCVACQKAQVRFVAERALFEERADVVPTLSITEPEMIESVTQAVLERRNAKVLRFARTVVAFAACAAAVFVSVWMHEHSTTTPVASEAAASSSSSSPALLTPNVNMSVAPEAAEEQQQEQQTMACAFPMSGSFSNNPTGVSDLALSSALEAPASVGSIGSIVDHQGTCEAPLSSSGSSMISWRVTSSFATP